MSEKLLYVCFLSESPGNEDGGEIYDRKTIAALQRCGAEVEVLSVPRRKKPGIPTWVSRCPPDAARVIENGRERGQRIILSHEGLFEVDCGISVDLLIVHNYFPAFHFATRRLLTAYYRLGAKRYFSKHFQRARRIVFLSHNDLTAANKDFPYIGKKSVVLSPPPFESNRLERNMSVIHMSGTDDWLPKRLSRLSAAEYELIRLAGFTIRDFAAEECPAFGFINDQFSVGFKLKLMQMIHSRDVIAARCSIADEIENIAPGYPFYREVDSVSAAIGYFRSVAEQYSSAEIDAEFDIRLHALHIASWDDMSSRLADLAGG